MLYLYIAACIVLQSVVLDVCLLVEFIPSL